MGNQRAHRRKQLAEPSISFTATAIEIPEPHVPSVSLPECCEPTERDVHTARREADRARRKASSYLRRSQEAAERGEPRDAYVWSARAVLADARAQAYTFLSQGR